MLCSGCGAPMQSAVYGDETWMECESCDISLGPEELAELNLAEPDTFATEED